MCLFGNNEASVSLLQEFVRWASFTLCDLEFLFSCRKRGNFAQLVKQVLVLSGVLTRFINPRQHFVNMLLVNALHELAASAREIVAVHV